jgi:hypothetical protein
VELERLELQALAEALELVEMLDLVVAQELLELAGQADQTLVSQAV